jgi:hypothetical protein
MISICFHSPLLCIRGSSVAIYDYADCNESILGNKSIILTPRDVDHNPLALRKFSNRFSVYFYDDLYQMNKIIKEKKCDIFYAIKHGQIDGIVAKNIKNVIHCVFVLDQLHGDVCAAVSSALAVKYNHPLFVPHMIGLQPSKTRANMRIALHIPNDDIVFGRYGGMDTFNLPFTYDIINQIVIDRADIWFIFINTPAFANHPRILFLDNIIDDSDKNKFINTCDAHIEAGSLGHSFGLAIAEFSVNNKPIIAYNPDGWMWNRAHIEILGDKALYFKDGTELYDILSFFNPKDWECKDNNCYNEYTPEKVMKIFKDVFIDS